MSDPDRKKLLMTSFTVRFTQAIYGSHRSNLQEELSYGFF